MKRIIRPALVFLCYSTALLAPSPALALIQVGRGNVQVQDAGWPLGALDVANLKSRVGWWEGPPFGGGEWQFLYRGTTEEFVQALTNFAAIRAPALELVIHDGPQENQFLADDIDPKADTRVDWTFTVWVPASWHRLYNNPKSIFAASQPQFRQPVDRPRLDVYIGGGGQVDWAKVTVPRNVRVRDERASAAGIDLSGGAVIQAEFFDMDSGKPVTGARLVVERTWWTNAPTPHWEAAFLTEATSDATGRLQVERIPTNMIRVSVVADGYASRRLLFRAFARPTLVKISTELANMAVVRGTVTDSEGKPIQGAKVRPLEILGSDGLGYDTGLHYDPYERWNVETDSGGHFEFAGLPAGFAQFSATMPRYYFSDSFTIHDVPATNLVLRLLGAGGIRVTVADKSGTPISRLEGQPLIVEVEPKEGSTVGSWSGSATVKDDGTYEFKNMPPGEYRITSRPNPGSSNRQYAPEQIVTVKPGVPVEVKVVYE